MRAHSGEKIDAELVEQVDHIDEHPVFGELALGFQPKVDAVEGDLVAGGGGVLINAGMGGQNPRKALRADHTIFGDEVV